MRNTSSIILAVSLNLVNGHTGRMAGEYPKSPWKVALLVIGIIIVILILLLVSQNQ